MIFKNLFSFSDDECQTSEDPDGHILERDDLNLLINYMNNWSTK